MKLVLFSVLIVFLFSIGTFSFVSADSFDKTIVAGDKEYEFGEITKEYKMSKKSSITKTQGYTTTGEMFFLRTSDSFEKIMILDLNGHWQKAELKQKPIQEKQPVESIIIQKKTDLHVLTDQYERVNNGEEYTVFVKTFDESIYSGDDFGNFDGKISGAKVTGIIVDPNGEVKHDFDGIVENGLFENSVTVPENLWQRGWYVVDLAVEFEGKFQFEQLTFYVSGEPSDKSGCPFGTSRVNGICV